MSENAHDDMQGNVQEYILCLALNLSFGIHTYTRLFMFIFTTTLD